MSGSPLKKSKADRIDKLLSGCIVLAVLFTVFEMAELHYVRALLAGVSFVVLAPWLGRRWINRID
jgi:hypothetical protein